ncbi:MAG: Trk system potassium transporter TrkA [Bacteroidota bacterium]|nr:Trk system potassium transporter TrkA [Bacteroidota bacterium]MEC8367502.1 Trk system potassium transporter TrkA [Bacteroidota bacterium]MEC8601887.1 Trk system potassium transporter TrkA [Bacteroidota bacterium]
MKIIIAGAGEVGLHLSKLLSFESHDITLIDNNDVNLKDGENYLDIKVINGDSSSISTLGQANVKDSDLVIGVTASESINFLTCSLSKQLGANRTIARITNPEFINDNTIDFKKLGIDEIISPENLAVNEIKLLVNDSAFTNSHDFEDGELKMMAARIQIDAPFIGKEVQEAASVYPGIKFMPIAIERSGSQSAIIPRGNTLFKEDDHVYFITCDDGVDELYKLMGTKKDKLQNIMILGGGRVGFKVAQELSEQGYSVKLVEINNDKAEKIADQLNNVLVLNLDGTRVDLLSEENLDQMDAFISTTGDSQKNIMSCLMAKSKKIKKTIALVDDSDYFELSESIGVDTLINKKFLAANEIFRFIRKGNILELNKLNNMNAEVLEFLVSSNSKVIGKKIKDINFPRSAIIGGVIRDDKGLIALGDFQIQEGDKVLICSLYEGISKVEKLFF